MFISRRIELGRLEAFMSSADTAALVYGRRRVGKTSLVREATKSFQGKIISYLCTRESYEVNRTDLVSEYCLAFSDTNSVIPIISSSRAMTSFP